MRRRYPVPEHHAGFLGSERLAAPFAAISVSVPSSTQCVSAPGMRPDALPGQDGLAKRGRMGRPACVVHAWDVEGERRPRYTTWPGVGAVVRRLGDAVGLTHMGVQLRTIDPGMAGTNRHFHVVEEEWVYVLSGCGMVRIGPHRLPVRAGSFVGFPPGPRPHHFLAAGDEPLVLLEGGERRPDA